MNEEEEICKVCRGPGEENEPLKSPCDCKGSIKFVHQRCLQDWLAHSQSKKCEVCNRDYKFRPIYHRDTPSILSPFDMLTGLSKLFYTHILRTSRLLLACFCWFLLIPWTTCRLWYFFFSMTVPIDTPQILSDSALGSLLFGFILCGSLGILSLIDFLRSLKLMERLNDAIAGQREGDQNNHNQAGQEAADQPAVQPGEVQNNIAGFEDALFGLLEARNGQNEELEIDDAPQEMAGIKGPLLGFLWHILSILLFNSVVLATFVLVPIFAGKLFSRVGSHALATEKVVTEKGSSTLSLLIGYGVIIAFSIIYICALFVKQKFFELGAFEKQIAGFVLFMFTAIKVTILFLCEVILFPIFCANLINFFTLPLFSTTWDERRDVILEHPVFSTCVLWFVGFLFVLSFSVVIKNLRALLRPEVLWFLRNPDDPSFSLLRDMVKEPILQHGKRFVSSGILYAALIILCIAAPINLSIYLFPDLTPLRATNGAYIDPFDIMFFHVGLTQMTALWLYTVAYVLDLNDYFFGKIGEDGVPERFHNPPAEDEEDQESDGQPQTEVYKPWGFGWRIAIVLFLAWGSVLAFCLAFMTIPLLVGRFCLTYVAIVGDFYAYVLGFYLTWGLAGLISYTVTAFMNSTISLTASFYRAIEISRKIIAAFGLFLLWFGVLPALIGYWFQNTYITPFKVEYNQTPAQIPKYTFVIGTLCLNLWCRSVMVHGMFDTWRIKFEKVRDDGFENLDFWYIVSEIIIPIFHVLMSSLCVPYAFNRLALPYFDFEPLTSLQIERFSYLAFTFLIIIWKGLDQVVEWLIRLHSQIRDDKYLIGQLLENADANERVVARPDIQEQPLVG